LIGALLVLGAIALMAFVFGRGGGGGFSPPDADGLEQVVEVDQVASSSKMDVVSGLQRPSDERHPDPLVDLREIRSGGPPPDGIPPIDRPFFETASSIDWLDDSEAVVVLEMGAETRAYPVQVLTWHEIVNDTVDGEPVTVSYCPLCNSAVAYERTLDDGTILDFGTSGSLYNSSLIMYDRQTESLWTHFDGLAVVGHLTGTQLTLLPMVTVAWSDFVSAYPNALVLSRATGFSRDYGSNPYPGYDDPNNPPFLFSGTTDERLRPKDRVAVARLGEDSVTVAWEKLAVAGVHSTVIGGVEVVFLYASGTVSPLHRQTVAGGRDVGAVAVYEAGEVAAGMTPSGEPGLFESADGSRWNLFGEAVSGPAAGERLRPVEHLDTFWFAIAAFDPDTRLESPRS